MKSLTFNNQKIEIFRQDDQIWLTSSELARALGYKSTKSITNLYNANADEFTDGMTLVTESVTNGINNSLREITVRIFSLRGCHLIAMFARTAVAKEFRKWVLDILDNLSMRKSTTSIFINERQAQVIQSAVNQIKEETGESWQSIYSRIHQKFNVTSYLEILQQDFEQVMEFLNKRSENTFNDEQSYNLQREQDIFNEGILRAGLGRYFELSEAHRRVFSELMDGIDLIDAGRKKVYEAGRKFRHIGRNTGIIYDAMAEPLMRMKFSLSTREEAQAKAQRLAKPFDLEDWS